MFCLRWCCDADFFLFFAMYVIFELKNAREICARNMYQAGRRRGKAIGLTLKMWILLQSVYYLNSTWVGTAPHMPYSDIWSAMFEFFYMNRRNFFATWNIIWRILLCCHAYWIRWFNLCVISTQFVFTCKLYVVRKW